MHLLTLCVRNLGVFGGAHEFALGPMGQAARNVTLISGDNGVGKSTLYEALALALHGSQTLGNRVSQQAYSAFLVSRLHRRSVDGAARVATEGGVALDLGYVRSGRPLSVRIERHWERHEDAVRETLCVAENGNSLDVPREDYQAWLNELLPPGLAPLCFFDAERTDTASSSTRPDELLGRTLRRLLGLDLVERLESDLRTYTRRHGAGEKGEQLRRQLGHCEAALGELSRELDSIEAEERALSAKEGELEAQLSQVQHRLTVEGGTYAARRDLLVERLAWVEAQMGDASAQLSELAGGLLPFSLLPQLCRSLEQRLDTELAERRQEIAQAFLAERLGELRSHLMASDLWQGLDISDETRHALADRLDRMLCDASIASAAGRHRWVHRLADPDREKLRDWISQAVNAVPRQVEWLGAHLGALESERAQLEADLLRAPDDDELAPIHAELVTLQQGLATVRKGREQLRDRMGALRYQQMERERERERLDSELRVAQAKERQLALAHRSRDVLLDYRHALTRQRLGFLEAALVGAFNTICRKEHLVSAAHVDPENLRVHLVGAAGEELDLARFSAGERQIYTLALLWALRRVSGRQLPLAVDTPLARLDDLHRHRLMREYVPQVSDQVVLFASTAELDSGILADAQPCLARVYRLEYDPRREQSSVYCEEQPVGGEMGARGIFGGRS